MDVIDLITETVAEAETGGFIKTFEMNSAGYNFIFESGETLRFLYDEHADRCLLIYDGPDKFMKWWITPNTYKLGSVIIIIREGGTGELYAVGNSED